MSYYFVPKEIPTWLMTINDKSAIGTKDIMELFGFSSVESVSSAACHGSFPKPDLIRNLSCSKNKSRLMWRKSTILAEIKRRQDSNNKQPLADTAPPDADRG